MSAALRWSSLVPSGQSPEAMLIGGRLVALTPQLFVLIGGQCGRRSRRVYVLQQKELDGDWNWREVYDTPGECPPELSMHTLFPCTLTTRRGLQKNLIFLFGGSTGSFVYSAGSYVLDLDRPKPVWRKLFSDDAPAARDGAAGVFHNNEIFLFGGQCTPLSGETGLRKDLWKMNIDNIDLYEHIPKTYAGGLGGAKWTEVCCNEAKPRPSERSNHAVASVPGVGMYMFGGLSDPVHRTKLGDLWCLTGGGSYVVILSSALSVVGTRNSWTTTAGRWDEEVQLCHNELDEWNLMLSTSCAGEFWKKSSPRDQHITSSIPRRVLLIPPRPPYLLDKSSAGGGTSSSSLRWSNVCAVGKTPAPRAGHALLFVKPDSLLVWGGLLGDEEFGREV